MSTYTVVIDEVITHTFVIECDNVDEADTIASDYINLNAQDVKIVSHDSESWGTNGDTEITPN
jgi:hypothetical protein